MNNIDWRRFNAMLAGRGLAEATPALAQTRRFFAISGI
jgi:hypothetical protein